MPKRPPLPPQLCDVPPEHIDLLWPHLEPLLEAATAESHGRETAADVRRALMACDAKLWIWWENDTVELLAVTEVVRHPRKTVARIKICTGRGTPDRFRQCTLILEAWAKDQGATAMLLNARKGWERILRPIGYEATHVCLEKDFDHA